MFSLVRATGLGAFHLFNNVHIVPCDAYGAIASCEYAVGRWGLFHSFYRDGKSSVVMLAVARPGSIRVEVGRPELSVRVSSDRSDEFPITVCEAASLAAAVFSSIEEGGFDPANYETVPPASGRNPEYSLLIDGFTVEIFSKPA